MAVVDAKDIERLARLLHVSAETTALMSTEQMSPQLRARLGAMARMIEFSAAEITEIAAEILAETTRRVPCN